MSSGDSPKGSIGVVLDVGSLDTKAGFGGEAFPRCIIPTTVGRFRRLGLIDGFPDIYFGKEAIQKRGLSNLTWPVQDGFIDNWDEMEKFWHHLFYKELYVAPEQAQVIYAVHPLIPKKHKERIAEIFFESFMIRGLYLVSTSVLSLHAHGKTSGVVWENGYSCCHTMAVFEGFPLKHTYVRSNINGRALTEGLQSLLAKKGYQFTTAVETDILNRIKAKLCYVAIDYDEEISSVTKGEDISYELPDGQHILIGNERFMCPEILFRPSLHNNAHKSIVDDICSCINKCDLDYKSLFFSNIVVSGASSLFRGLPERLALELSKRVIDLPDIKVKVDALPSRSAAAWAGGSIMASLSTMNNFWMTIKEYEDSGTDSVNYKFY